MPIPTKDPQTASSLTEPQENTPVTLDPCEKAHDAEHDRFTDEDGACDDGVN
jgi:hypothetical protein